jgi:quercetin dioxygenase-like cupin family protein
MLYTHIADLLTVQDIPTDSTISRTLYSDDRLKVVLFGFAAGQELSEHTAAMPAILQFIAGTATVTFGGDTIEAGPNTWVHMTPRLPHSILAQTPVVMLLTLLKAGG